MSGGPSHVRRALLSFLRVWPLPPSAPVVSFSENAQPSPEHPYEPPIAVGASDQTKIHRHAE